jgi:tRNA threonylcarbamoyladenosine biosynthesis protein TsaE
MVKFEKIEQLKNITKEFTQQLKSGDVIGLNGELGAGKTTFVQFVAQFLGITEVVNSPTYNYLKVYPIPETGTNLVHVDAYRLRTQADIDSVGLTEYLADPNNIIFIEWASNIADLLPGKTQYYIFEVRGEERSIEGPNL